MTKLTSSPITSKARWYYYPRMTRGEVLIFKQYDSSATDLSSMCFHTSFDVVSSVALDSRDVFRRAGGRRAVSRSLSRL